MKSLVAAGVLLSLSPVCSFSPRIPRTHHQPILVGAESASNRGVGAVAEEEKTEAQASASRLSIFEIKDNLLDLLPRMTGTEEEFREVELSVNTLESKYVPPQTLDFLNLAMGGEWQLLFSTNLRGGPRPFFRLKEMFQKVNPTGLKGSVVNVVRWDLMQDQESGIFDCSGTFSAVCSYEINQGARMIMELKDHTLELARGSAVPSDVQGLVGQIHRSMPTELFDPNQHAMDTTYLDGNLRITRMTGPSFEGIRNIFMRRGSIQINPLE
jgi:hypothetical protein